MCMTLQVHMQQRSFLPVAGRNKQALAVGSPTQRPQVAPTLHVDLLRRLAAQGKNVDRPLWTRSRSNAAAIRRKLKLPIVLLQIKLKAGKLWTASVHRVEAGDSNLFAIVGRLRNYTQLRRRLRAGE